MSDAAFHELFPLGADDTPYRKLTGDFVSPASFEGERVVKVAPDALTLLTRQAFVDCQHLLRPGHLAQLRTILDDPGASANDVPGHRHRDRHGKKRPTGVDRRR
jgi:fumarate hydratase class I